MDKTILFTKIQYFTEKSNGLFKYLTNVNSVTGHPSLRVAKFCFYFAIP